MIRVYIDRLLSNSCFSPLSVAPKIVSTPYLSGEVAVEYQYDADGIIDITASSQVSFNLDIAPDGMTLSQSGELRWVPSLNDVGVVPIQISITNAQGSDTQYFEIIVENPLNGVPVNFNQENIKKYWGQPGDGSISITGSGDELSVQGNNWQYILSNFEISDSTVIAFEFRSDAIGELHGVGFMNGGELRPELFFTLAGSESFGISDYVYFNEGEYQKFIIPVGKFFTGAFQRFIIASDNDMNMSGVNSVIRNFVIYDDPSGNYDIEAPKFRSSPSLVAIAGNPYVYDEDSTVGITSTYDYSFNLDIAPSGMSLSPEGLISWTPDLNDVGTVPIQISVSSLAGIDTQYFEVIVQAPDEADAINFNNESVNTFWGQKGVGVTSVSDDGTELTLEGNNWQYILINSNITESTVLKFEIKSDLIGEIHGVGLMNGGNLLPELFFNLAGSEDFGITDYNYNEVGEFQIFEIPVGRYFKGSFQRIIIAADNDENIVGVNTIIRNLTLYEDEDAFFVSQPPKIRSLPSLSASVGESYSYDEDNRVGVTATNTYSFSLDAGPSGMTISENGEITWTPSEDDVGLVPVQISVSNAEGSDTQYFEVDVQNSGMINFNSLEIKKFWGQPGYGEVYTLDAGSELVLEGNHWQYILMEVAVTDSTVIEFEFKVDVVSENHGIGFMNGGTLDAETYFKLAGSEEFGVSDYSYTQTGEYQTFSIPIGQHFNGPFYRIVFAVDNDGNNQSGANTIIRNLRIIE